MSVGPKISKRIWNIVDALPLKDATNVLEIGCGTGVAAKEIAARIGNGIMVAIDRSGKTIAKATENTHPGNLKFIRAEIETFCPEQFENYFDIVFAIRVGALDGRHPEVETQAKENIGKMLKKDGKFFIQGDPIKEIKIARS